MRRPFVAEHCVQKDGEQLDATITRCRLSSSANPLSQLLPLEDSHQNANANAATIPTAFVQSGDSAITSGWRLMTASMERRRPGSCSSIPARSAANFARLELNKDRKRREHKPLAGSVGESDLDFTTPSVTAILQ